MDKCDREKKCGTCRHWGEEKFDGMHVCSVFEETQALGMMATSYDDSELYHDQHINTFLMTGKDFGCVLHEHCETFH